jgi:hypothetical protein
MENLCMQYLVVSFLKWVATSCVMWGLPTCLSTPSCAANNPRVVPPAAVVRLVHQAPLDRRALVALQARRVQVALRDRVVAAAHPAPDLEAADLVEVVAPPDKKGAQEPADTPGRAATQEAVARVRVGVLAAPVRVVRLAALVHLVVRDHPVALDPLDLAADHRVVRVVKVHPAQAVRRVRQVRQAAVHQEAAHQVMVPRVVQERKAARGQAAPVDRAVHPAPNLRGAVVRAAAARRADRAVNPARVRSPVHKAVANHQAPVLVLLDRAVVVLGQAALGQAVQAANHPVAATAVVQDRVVQDLALEADPVRAPVASALAVLVARGNPTDRAVLAVPHRAVAVLDRRAGAVAPATSHGMALRGMEWEYRIPAFHKSDHSVRRAFVTVPFPVVLVRTSDRFSIQDVSIKHDE